MKAKPSVIIILTCAILLSTTACTTTSQAKSNELSFDPEKRLYTTDNVGHSINRLPELLDKVLNESKSVILFVHGRGDEPEKSMIGTGMIVSNFVEGKAFRKLEEGYSANVLMFNWDSKRKGKGPIGLKDRSRPLSNMPIAARELASVLRGIKQYYEDKPNAKRMVLIAHSMGTIVVENIVKNQGGWVSNRPLFSNILLSSSDADDLNHKEWVEKISAIEKVYITVNVDDGTLIESTDERPEGAIALGLEPGAKLADKAIYVDITGLGKEKEGKDKKTEAHELFHKKSMHKQIHVCNFYHQVLTGQSVILNDENSTEIIPRQRYKLTFARNGQDDCFN